MTSDLISSCIEYILDQFFDSILKTKQLWRRRIENYIKIEVDRSVLIHRELLELDLCKRQDLGFRHISLEKRAS